MKKIYPLILIGLLLALTINNYAQDVEFAWAKSMGGSFDDDGQSITVDAVGNIYTTGSFLDTIDFDPGPGTYNLSSAGWKDIFIQKLDANGNFIWAKSMGGVSYDVGNSITIDALGNIYIIGVFEDTVDFDPGTGTYYLTSAGSRDIFIQKLDSSGNFIWAKSAGGSDYDGGSSIAVDTTGNVFVVPFTF